MKLFSSNLAISLLIICKNMNTKSPTYQQLLQSEWFIHSAAGRLMNQKLTSCNVLPVRKSSPIYMYNTCIYYFSLQKSCVRCFLPDKPTVTLISFNPLIWTPLIFIHVQLKEHNKQYIAAHSWHVLVKS